MVEPGSFFLDTAWPAGHADLDCGVCASVELLAANEVSPAKPRVLAGKGKKRGNDGLGGKQLSQIVSAIDDPDVTGQRAGIEGKSQSAGASGLYPVSCGAGLIFSGHRPVADPAVQKIPQAVNSNSRYQVR